MLLVAALAQVLSPSSRTGWKQKALNI